jgi:hypothetical protein
MHERCGEDFEGFNASNSPDNASPREREKVILSCALFQFFFLHNYTTVTHNHFLPFPASTWHHSAVALQDQPDQSGQTRSATCSCVQGHLSSPAQR